MEELKYILAAFLIMGFVYFLIVRAIRTKNYIRKSIYILISGSIVSLVFVGGIIYDVITKDFLYPNNKFDIYYFIYLIASVFYTILFFVLNYVKGYKLKQRFKSFVHTNKKVIPTIKEKKEYLYIILKHNNNFILKEAEDNLYESVVIKFANHDFFHDELIQKVIQEKRWLINNYEYIGKATLTTKKDNIYYCYIVNLESCESLDINFKEFEVGQLIKINMNDMDKKIIYTSVIDKNFDINI